jgi:hypothetical protein
MVDKSNKSLDDPAYAGPPTRAQALSAPVMSPAMRADGAAPRLRGEPDYTALARQMLQFLRDPRSGMATPHIRGLDPGQPPYVGLEQHVNRMYADPRLLNPIPRLGNDLMPSERQWALPPNPQPSSF